MNQSYLSNKEILHLIESPKKIVRKKPRDGFARHGRYNTCRLKLHSTNMGEVFEVFIKQHIEHPEGFSIGLMHKIYKIKEKELMEIVLVRYNGPHGETSKSPDGHYCAPHIHRMTAEEMRSGNSHPQEKYRKITDRYKTFESALGIFFKDTGVVNYSKFFSYIRPGQRELFHDRY